MQHQIFTSSNIHLIVPATHGNKYFCQFLISSVILNYPTPVLVNWDSPEKDDSPQRYVTKVDSISAYLDQFPATKDNDLVLIADGFDVWFQLPPDVLIRRYFKTIELHNKRLASTLGSSARRKNDIRQSILFSADKACGPRENGNWVGCWAVPQSTMPMYSYGPYNDTLFDDAKQNSFHARPRWLSAGMMIGPVQDLKILYQETSKLMHAEHDPDPDQWFFGQLYGVQEYSRAMLESRPSLTNVNSPKVSPGQKTEFHIGLDYESSMFQTIGYNDQYLTWWQYDGSRDAAMPKEALKENPYHFKLSSDILKARRPFESMHNLKMSAYNEKYQEILKKAGRPDFQMWRNFPLATNVITRDVFPSMHFGFEKDYRDIWWEKMWFFPHARDLLHSSGVISVDPVHHERINGKIWYNSQYPVSSYLEGSNQERRDGAWNDKGEWKSFSGMCDIHEEALFGTS